MTRYLVFLALAPGCSDYALNHRFTETAPGESKEPVEHVPLPTPDPTDIDEPAGEPPPRPAAPATIPDIVTDPLELALRGFCAEDTRDVSVRNRGDAPLTVTAIRLTGAGWSMAPVTLPFVLDPGQASPLHLTTTGGEGMLEIESDDPDQPLVRLPLSATPNAPPIATITAPTDGLVVAEGGALELRGLVSDDLDPPESLGIAWTASVEGPLGSDPAGPDGIVAFAWPAAARGVGDQTVTLTATDSCGLPAVDSAPLCQDGTITFDALTLPGWHFEGESYIESATGWLVLTEDARDVVGTAFETSRPIDGDNVILEFRFYIGGGTGADGISLTALDTTRMTTFLGGTGCGIGYGDADCTSGPALPGWSIEVDTWYNRGQDPTALDHVAFTFDGDVTTPKVWTELPEMEDTSWHTMLVDIAAPRVKVLIDGIVYIDEDIEGHWDFPAYVGFTGGTGTYTNWHVIEDLLVTDPVCD